MHIVVGSTAWIFLLLSTLNIECFNGTSNEESTTKNASANDTKPPPPSHPLITFDEFVKTLTFNQYPEPTQEQYETVTDLAKDFDINDKQELAMFLAQVYWESMGLQVKNLIFVSQSCHLFPFLAHQRDSLCHQQVSNSLSYWEGGGEQVLLRSRLHSTDLVGQLRELFARPVRRHETGGQSRSRFGHSRRCLGISILVLEQVCSRYS